MGQSPGEGAGGSYGTRVSHVGKIILAVDGDPSEGPGETRVQRRSHGEKPEAVRREVSSPYSSLCSCNGDGSMPTKTVHRWDTLPTCTKEYPRRCKWKLLGGAS